MDQRVESSGWVPLAVAVEPFSSDQWARARLSRVILKGLRRFKILVVLEAPEAPEAPEVLAVPEAPVVLAILAAHPLGLRDSRPKVPRPNLHPQPSSMAQVLPVEVPAAMAAVQAVAQEVAAVVTVVTPAATISSCSTVPFS